jgi:hypothetical protein
VSAEVNHHLWRLSDRDIMLGIDKDLLKGAGVVSAGTQCHWVGEAGHAQTMEPAYGHPSKSAYPKT